MYKSGADHQGLDGTQIWVRHELSKLVTESVPISTRILRITLCMQGKAVHIFSAHAPTEAAESATKDAFWSLLDQ